jgi:mannosyltransferase OCH1-like enzyme
MVSAYWYLLVASLLLSVALTIELNDFELPHLPVPSQRLESSASGADNVIPKHIWITAKSFNNVPKHIQTLIGRNRQWQTHLIDNAKMDRFMHTTFANTSTLVAYSLVNPTLGSVKADIWRMAVLWYYGGVYIDHDATLTTNLDEVSCKQIKAELGGPATNLKLSIPDLYSTGLSARNTVL